MSWPGQADAAATSAHRQSVHRRRRPVFQLSGIDQSTNFTIDRQFVATWLCRLHSRRNAKEGSRRQGRSIGPDGDRYFPNFGFGSRAAPGIDHPGIVYSSIKELPEALFGGYIFDCDGTLANSMPLHLLAWRNAFEQAGAEFEFTPDLFMEYAGVGHRDTVVQLNDRFGSSIDPDVCVEAKESWYERNMGDLDTIPEVIRLLQTVRDQRPVCVASGGPRSLVDKTLKIIGLADQFHIVVTQDDVTRSKPDPEMFLLAARKMGVDPGDCLVIEDSQLGIRAAQTAGMTSVLVESRL